MDTQTQHSLETALKASQIWWQDMGVDTPAIASTVKRTVAAKSARTKPARVPVTQKEEPKAPDAQQRATRAEALAKSAPTLSALKIAIEGFDAGVLSDHAKNIVFSRANPKADIMIIGESPGQIEDEQGKPFVGAAGQLLDKMFAAIGQTEDSLYITNVCNWRPPANRNPTEEELAFCKPFITRHIELAAPKLVVIVGGIALQALTGKTGIMKTRGQWQELDIAGTKIPAMPLYHPAFLLRRPELKKYAWRDLLTLKESISQLSP